MWNNLPDCVPYEQMSAELDGNENICENCGIRTRLSPLCLQCGKEGLEEDNED